jgi:hypothetical protein
VTLPEQPVAGVSPLPRERHRPTVVCGAAPFVLRGLVTPPS